MNAFRTNVVNISCNAFYKIKYKNYYLLIFYINMVLPDIQENNEQILNNIQSLQSIEQQLFNSLETNPNLSSQQQQQIVAKMNQLSNMRINLYQTLSGINGFFQNALASSHGTLQEQTVAINIV